MRRYFKKVSIISCFGMLLMNSVTASADQIDIDSEQFVDASKCVVSVKDESKFKLCPQKWGVAKLKKAVKGKRGRCVLRFNTDVDGKPENVRLEFRFAQDVHPYPQVCIQTVRKWKFDPAPSNTKRDIYVTLNYVPQWSASPNRQKYNLEVSFTDFETDINESIKAQFLMKITVPKVYGNYQ